MAGLERAHWFLRESCDLKRCTYCFGPIPEGEVSPERDFKIAQVLVDGGVKEVVLGGGEPSLARNLEEVMRILKDGGIYISLHTNGLSLTDERLDRWVGLVDDIALPIDAVDRTIQGQLREEKFMEVFDNLMRWAEKINSRGIKTGWHTVFTALNGDEIPKIYRLIKGKPFKYWRIYEYNSDLARQVWLTMNGPNDTSDERIIAGFLRARALEGSGTPEKGYTDCLLADFLRMEERMERLGDNRIQFVARVDNKEEPYAFCRNDGQVNYYAWYSSAKRRRLGNILKEGFPIVEERWVRIRDMDDFDEDDRADAGCDLPLWARLDDGFYLAEEIEEVLPEYIPEVERLADLWAKRNGL